MKAATQRRLTPVLALAAGILGAVFVALLLGAGRGVHWNAPHAVADLPPPGRAAALPPPEPLDRFALVWQKPLFSPDRRPVARADAGGAVGDLALTGVILTRGMRIALVHDKSADRDLQIVQGKATPDGGWTLVELRPRSAVFDAPSGRVELKLPEGAPFDKVAPTSRTQPGAAEMRRGMPEGEVVPSGGQGMRGPPPGRSQRARQSQADLQAERIRRLNAVIQKRRAEHAASTPQGVR